MSFTGEVIGTSAFPQPFTPHGIFRLPVVSSCSEVSAGTKFLRKINIGGLGGIIIRSLRLIVLCFRRERLLERGAAALNQFHGLFITEEITPIFSIQFYGVIRVDGERTPAERAQGHGALPAAAPRAT